MLPVLMFIFKMQPTNGDLVLIVAGNFILCLFMLCFIKYRRRHILCKEFASIKNVASKEIFAYEMLRCILSKDLDD